MFYFRSLTFPLFVAAEVFLWDRSMMAFPAVKIAVAVWCFCE
jgi:hypothetical protein